MENLAGRCSWAEGNLPTGPEEWEIGADSAVLSVPQCICREGMVCTQQLPNHLSGGMVQIPEF